ncbi:MAG: tRNA (adenosine(37)-N6)-threonylcarbamoyltransferase complex transferase subunit TsaD [Chloroflexi bacterium]|nr:tRNA (adenosine(37)-N6)-threonylcarbamoyltransferase complex transferase subunit TsaD [Chloroflexota bacterium]
MRILGIETSCDETAAAVVEDGTRILSNVIASQVEIHSRYGGIVPEVASRQHLLACIPTLDRALKEASMSVAEVDAVAVTSGPGLAGSLVVGVNLAKSAAMAHGLPLVSVNHLEGHIYANWLEGNNRLPEFPLLCLIVSGGHTDIILMTGHGEYRQLGRTRDDAAGEAFDKVARLLGLGYPGGPVIERAARGIEKPRHLPRSWLKGTDDFSFSGIKTAALHMAHELGVTSENPSPESGRMAAEIAAGFQESVVEVLVAKTCEAAQRHAVREILLAGGVAANALLRKTMVERAPVPVRIPKPILCTDNAAMIASCGYFRFKAGKTAGWDLDVDPNLRLV